MEMMMMEKRYVTRDQIIEYDYVLLYYFVRQAVHAGRRIGMPVHIIILCNIACNMYASSQISYL